MHFLTTISYVQEQGGSRAMTGSMGHTNPGAQGLDLFSCYDLYFSLS